jgi:hypothetical protein
VDEGAYGSLALQEIVQPCPRGRVDEGYDGSVCGVVWCGKDLSKRTSEFLTTRKGGLDRLIRLYGYVLGGEVAQ